MTKSKFTIFLAEYLHMDIVTTQFCVFVLVTVYFVGLTICTKTKCSQNQINDK